MSLLLCSPPDASGLLTRSRTPASHGEDCWFGDLTDQYFYCHPTNSSGVSLLYSGHAEDLSVNDHTVFANSSFGDTVTDYIGGDGICWAWGHDVSDYAALDCQ